MRKAKKLSRKSSMMKCNALKNEIAILKDTNVYLIRVVLCPKNMKTGQLNAEVTNAAHNLYCTVSNIQISRIQEIGARNVSNASFNMLTSNKKGERSDSSRKNYVRPNLQQNPTIIDTSFANARFQWSTVVTRAKPKTKMLVIVCSGSKIPTNTNCKLKGATRRRWIYIGHISGKDVSVQDIKNDVSNLDPDETLEI
ncbi:hypothetical protein HHI36_007960 [Cryptolaemus montrouzieri]|uniref:Uncharacterized protein n=1 Tax=Cryptolaemus montrouzieri TaxID=559131 RepID=A0ABD2MRZ4_9CUCU